MKQVVQKSEIKIGLVIVQSRKENIERNCLQEEHHLLLLELLNKQD